MKVTKATVRRLYREAIVAIWGYDNVDDDPYFKEENDRLEAAAKRDVHYGDKAPGRWCFNSVLEIYCENGIPNASDIREFPPMPEFGFKGSCVYHADRWALVDDHVNLFLQAVGSPRRFYHEPYNNAVINIHEE